MDAAAARSKAVAGGEQLAAGRDGSGGNEEVSWRRAWPGWRPPARVEVVVMGFLSTSTLLMLAFGGAGNHQPAFSSSPRSEFVQIPGTKTNQWRTLALRLVVRMHAESCLSQPIY